MHIKNLGTTFKHTPGVTVNLIVAYYLVIMALGVLIGQHIITANLARVMLAAYVLFGICLILVGRVKHSSYANFFSYAHAFSYAKSLKLDFPSWLLVIFCFLASIFSLIVGAGTISVLQALALITIYMFLKLSISSFTQKDIASLITILGYVSILYGLITVAAIFWYPGIVFGDAVAFKNRGDFTLLGLSFNANTSATYLLSAWLTTMLACYVTSAWQRLGFFIATIMLLLLILVTGCRASGIPALLIFIVVTPYYIYCGIADLKQKFSVSIVNTVLSLTILLLLTLFYRYYAAIHYYLFAGGDNGRLGIWQCTIKYLFKHNWTCGFGLGRQDIPMAACGYNYGQAHNTFVDVLLGGGIINFLIFGGFIAATSSLVLRQYLLSKKALYLWLFLAQLALLLHSLVESYLINKLASNYFIYILCFLLASRNMYLDRGCAA